MLGVVMSHSCYPSTCEARQEDHKFSSSMGNLAKTLGVEDVAHGVEYLSNRPKALG